MGEGRNNGRASRLSTVDRPAPEQRDVTLAHFPASSAVASTAPAVALPAGAPVARYLRAPEVCSRVALSRTTIWRLVRGGQFPAPRQLSPNAIGWLASEVDAWIATRAIHSANRAP
jgi:prophage regulatory protein